MVCEKNTLVRSGRDWNRRVHLWSTNSLDLLKGQEFSTVAKGFFSYIAVQFRRQTHNSGEIWFLCCGAVQNIVVWWVSNLAPNISLQPQQMDVLKVTLTPCPHVTNIFHVMSFCPYRGWSGAHMALDTGILWKKNKINVKIQTWCQIKLIVLHLNSNLKFWQKILNKICFNLLIKNIFPYNIPLTM